MYSKKATKFCEISTLLLSYLLPVKSKVQISQNFVVFLEYVNFITLWHSTFYQNDHKDYFSDKKKPRHFVCCD